MAKWTVAPRVFADKMGRDLTDSVQKVTYRLFRAVAIKSPVDTGLFSGNWRLTVGAPAVGTLQRLDPTRMLAQQQAALALVAKPGGVVYFSNNLPYALRLEHGWSKQAPAGMVRIALAEVSAWLATTRTL